MSRSKRLTVRDWRKGFAVVDPNEKESISYALWERQNYVSGTTTELVYFTARQDGINGNMPLAGQLPQGWSFLIQAIRFAPFPNSTELAQIAGADGPAQGALQDIILLTRECHVALNIGDKEYSRWPAWMLPSGGGPTGQLAGVGTAAAGSQATFQVATSGVADPRACYTLPVPIAIPEQYSFRVTARFNGAQTLQAGNTLIYVVLDGELIRPKQ